MVLLSLECPLPCLEIFYVVPALGVWGGQDISILLRGWAGAGAEARREAKGDGREGEGHIPLR